MCFSGKYTKAEVMKKLVGKGGAVGFFGTNDFRSILDRAAAGEQDCKVFVDGYCMSIAKYIGALATDVCGKVDAILITGGIARSQAVIENVTSKVSFIAPVKVYPGEDELESLAENGYGILAKEFEIKTYHKEG
jgi:butyrate kinase